MKLQYTFGYVALIVLVNVGFSIIPLVELPNGDVWPPMSLVVGLIFVIRDFAQREIGHRIIIAMLVAGIISYVMADPFVAIASVIAFAISELSDWAVYSFTGRSFSERILISSAISTPLDSVVFLLMITFSIPYIIANPFVSIAGVATGVITMTISKMLGALVVWWLVRRREVSSK